MLDQEISRRRALRMAGQLGALAAIGGMRNGDALAQAGPPTYGWEAIDGGREGPGARSRHSMVYDAKRKVVVLFGGVNWESSRFKGNTLEFSGGRWTDRTAEVRPKPRHRGAMAFMDARGVSVLFGGQDINNNMLGDTWTYSDGRWREVPNGGVAPPARCGHAMAYDPGTGAILLYGGVTADHDSVGDTWSFDGSAWRKVADDGPSRRRYSAMAYAPELKGCLLHGGSSDDFGERSFGDTWLFRDGKWGRQGKAFETDPRDDHGLAYHAGLKRMIMLEGVAGRRGALVLESKGWRRFELDPIHPRHQCAPMVYVPELAGLMLHGGEVGQNGKQFDRTMVLKEIKRS